MRKFLILFVLSFSLGFLLVSFISYASQATMTTYYPSPGGTYTKVHLVNSGSGPNESSYCTQAGHAGAIFADPTTGFLEICKNDGSVASYPGGSFNRFCATGSAGCPSCPPNYTIVPNTGGPFAGITSYSCAYTSGGSYAKSGCFSIYSNGSNGPADCSTVDANAYDMGCSNYATNCATVRTCCFNGSLGGLPLGQNSTANCTPAACCLTMTYGLATWSDPGSASVCGACSVLPHGCDCSFQYCVASGHVTGYAESDTNCVDPNAANEVADSGNTYQCTPTLYVDATSDCNTDSSTNCPETDMRWPGGAKSGEVSTPVGNIGSSYAVTCLTDPGDIDSPSMTCDSGGTWGAPTSGICCKAGTCAQGIMGHYICTAFGCSGGTCFVAGTKVTMASGKDVPIEQLKVGDMLLGPGGAHNKIVKMDILPQGNQLIYAFNGGRFFVTSDHLFKTTAGWKSIDLQAGQRRHPDVKVAGQLTIGDEFITATGLVRLNKIESKMFRDPVIYDPEIDGTHEYYSDGYVVHNCCATC